MQSDFNSIHPCIKNMMAGVPLLSRSSLSEHSLRLLSVSIEGTRKLCTVGALRAHCRQSNANQHQGVTHRLRGWGWGAAQLGQV